MNNESTALEHGKVPASPSLHDEQVRLLRAALISSVFEKYADLVNVLKKLPLDQATPSIQHAYLSMDTAMLWFREILNVAPLTVAAPSNPEDLKVVPVEVEKESA